MVAILISEPPPLVEAEGGLLRVKGTRVTLDTVVSAYQKGSTAEEIVSKYPSLKLADVYQVIGFYLRHGAEVDEYLAERHRIAAKVRAENEARCPPEGIRARLLARRRG